MLNADHYCYGNFHNWETTILLLIVQITDSSRPDCGRRPPSHALTAAVPGSGRSSLGLQIQAASFPCRGRYLN